MPNAIKCFRTLIFAYSIFFGVFGLVLAFFNSVLLYYHIQYEIFIDSNSIVSTALVIVMGLLCCVLSKFACSATYKSNKCSILMVGLLFFSLALISFGIMVWFLYILFVLKDIITVSVESSFNSVTVNKDESITKIWERIQSELFCCGIGGPTDYRSSQSLPWSCCKRNSSEGVDIIGDCPSLHQNGCLLKIYDKIQEYLIYSMLSILSATIIQVVGVFSYYYMWKSLKRNSGGQRESTSPSSDAVTRGLLTAHPSKF